MRHVTYDDVNKRTLLVVLERGVCFPPALHFFNRELEPNREPPAIPVLVAVNLELHELAPLLSCNALFLSQFRAAVVPSCVDACVIG